ncbi:MAG: hypothetical protein K6C94_05820 [Candidatus Gastranaerophilales bacterium]|nr:hypothetical protein [Candidatus Gastranaerophilales bacterium]
MVNLLLIVLVVEITAFIWLIGKIDTLKDTIAKINEEIKNSGFTGSLTELRLSLEIFNKKFQNPFEENKEDKNLQMLDKFLKIGVFAFSVFSWYKKILPFKKKPKLLPKK